MSKSSEKSRIYRLEFDPAYQSLALADPELLKTPAFQFDSTSKANVWSAVELVGVDRVKPEPDFWKVEGLPTAFVCNARILGETPTLSGVTEALPVQFGNRSLSLVHVNERGCWDALDAQNCVWPLGTPGVGTPTRYAFLPRRLDFTTVMTVPETCEHEILVYANFDDPVYEFKADVKKQKLTGLVFRKVWSEKITPSR